MAKLFNAFLMMLAGATEQELILQVQYLKAENQILRGKLPGRITVTVAERTRLVELGGLFGAAIKDLITIVSPRTFARWAAAEKKGAAPAKRGRPRTLEETRQIVLRLPAERRVA
jgi:putative transposase